jgi:murein DD-endopeptidase MepM/ murein hydrolase activator NlpD
MNKYIFYLVLVIFMSSSCGTHGPFYVGIPYGAPVSYGERRHPGIDFDISVGTPIISSSDGVVTLIGKPDTKDPVRGGISVGITHSEHSGMLLYSHLTKIFVVGGQWLKRGQLIGLSGANNNGYAHLHFGICKIGGNCMNYSETYDPNKFWLGGKAQCFDPNKDYSNYSQREITLPVACGDYAKKLTLESKGKK